MPHGGVCHARKTIEPAATSSAGGSDDLASLAGVRSGVRQAGATILLLLLACGVAWGQVPDSEKDPQSPPSDLTKVSIENLMNMEVTSVSKKEQKMSQVAEAIFVITQDDIHHSGATNIPDLLRMAPGMDVTEGAVIVHSVLSPPDNLEVERLAKLSGGNVLTRWNHISSNRSDTTVKFYFDRYARSGPESREARDTIDFEFQNHLKIGNRQDLVWGLGYRHSADQTVGTIDQAFVPANWSGHSFNWYAQDQITLKRNRVDLFIGTKLEKGYFTGLDLQPSVRLTWTPTQRHTVWAAVSRATSTPTRREEGLNAGHQHSDSARRGLECGAGGTARAGRSCSAGKPGRKLRACYLLRVGVQDAAECPAVFRPRRIL